MNTNDIKLPPLPPGYKSYEFPDGGYDGDEMRAYAIDAIEADRKTYNSIGEGTVQQLHDVLLYLQNETMKLEAAYGRNFKKEATEKARAATEKMKEAVYAIKNIDRQRRGEPVAWMVPHIQSFKGVEWTNCPPSLQEKLEGTVAWTPSIIGDMPPVTDKHGATHHPRPLVYGDESPQPTEPSSHSIQDCPEVDKWNCKYCKRVNSCPVQGHQDAQPAEPVKYWLCCGSTDPTHADRKQPDCYDPDKAKFGTAESHKDSPYEPVKLCDCERGHNGMGMAGRECDCPSNNPQSADLDLAKCAECGAEMIHVRPGKWQHPDCSQSPQHSEPIVSDVEAIVRLLESREWAEHVATTPLGQRLETEVTALVGADPQPS